MHKTLAIDVSLHGHMLQSLVSKARAAGFTGFGYAYTFLHLDMGRPRQWYYGAASRERWKGIGP